MRVRRYVDGKLVDRARSDSPNKIGYDWKTGAGLTQLSVLFLKGERHAEEQPSEAGSDEPKDWPTDGSSKDSP